MIRAGILLATLAAIAATPAFAAGDPVKGKSVFAKCMVCHDVKPGVNRLGPSMAGIYGRQAATVPGFNYSPAMKKMAIKWDDANLHQYLEKPMQFVPGNRMAFVGLSKPQDRDDVIAYLKTLK